ncbi:MAG: hypothetical protein HQ591_01755 [candidate division Zixibacteria bacterium]|nr:hypothetical protein [Candidatus Tariuqbacter arcticus]
MTSLSINWEGQWWLLFLLIPAGIIFVVWGYRRTVPEISPALRAVLTAFRASAFCFLLILLFKPVIVLENEKTRPPELAVLIDQSASMSIADREGSRPETLQSILDDDNLSSMKRKFNRRFFHFSDTLVELSPFDYDSLNYIGAATDIARAITDAQGLIDNTNGAMLLITDGAYNSGAEPSRTARRSPIPIYVVGIGDTLPPLDLGIAEIKVNPLVYLGDEVPLEITVQGFSKAASTLELTAPNGESITRQRVEFPEGSTEKRLQMTFNPDEVGTRTYTLSLNLLEGESSAENNTRHFTAKVLESRIEILLVAGAPSSGLAFLRRILERNSNISLNILIQQKGGGFYPSDFKRTPADYDLIILLDYPTRGSDRNYLREISSAVESGLPLALIPGRSFEPRRLKEIEHLLPVQFGQRGKETAVKLSPNPGISPLTDFFPQEIDWGDLPPVRTFQGLVRIRPSASVLANLDNGEPAAAFSKFGSVKTVAWSAHDLWRLSLQDPEHSQGDSLISGFWRRAVRWLSTREEEELFRISTGKDIFTSGERIPFTAHIYDESYRPLPGAMVEIEIAGPEGNLSLDLNPTNVGEYTAAARFFQEGNYRYRGRAVSGEDTLATGGEFTVETFNPEFLDPAMRPNLLRNIADVSGGRFYLPAEFSAFFDDYTPPPVNYTQRKEVRIFPRWFSLIAVIALLTVEWVIRKRKGML